MGWSIDLIIEELDRIFGSTLYEVTVPESANPYARFNFEGEINVIKKRKIADLFPEGWYIYFHPNTIAEKPTMPPEVEFPT